MVSDNLKDVTQRIARCCEKSGRRAEDVSLVCVTKEATIEDAREALSAGAAILGENRLQSAIVKHRAIGDLALWHFIGHLQTNKARDAVKIFSLIHSVDSAYLAEVIDREAGRIGKIQDVLLQVNVSREETKFGVYCEEAAGFVKKFSEYRNIKMCGLMTIAPISGDPENSRPYFRTLRNLKDEINDSLPALYKMRSLSMGMTDDFEVAIEEGSTIVRIGRAIFER